MLFVIQSITSPAYLNPILPGFSCLWSRSLKNSRFLRTLYLYASCRGVSLAEIIVYPASPVLEQLDTLKARISILEDISMIWNNQMRCSVKEDFDRNNPLIWNYNLEDASLHLRDWLIDLTTASMGQESN